MRSLGWHRALVVVQLALCFVLLVCAGLLAARSISCSDTRSASSPQASLTMTFDLPGAVTRYGRDVAERASLPRTAAHARYARSRASSRRARRSDCRLQRSSTAPTRRASCGSTSETGRLHQNSGRLPGRKSSRTATWRRSAYRSSRAGPSMPVTRSTARRSSWSARSSSAGTFAGETVVGRTLVNLRRTPVTIVGVVGDVKPTSIGARRPSRRSTSPLAQSPPFRTRLAIRSHGDPRAILPMVRRVVTSIDPDLPVFDVKTLDGDRSPTLSRTSVSRCGCSACSPPSRWCSACSESTASSPIRWPTACRSSACASRSVRGRCSC